MDYNIVQQRGVDDYKALVTNRPEIFYTPRGIQRFTSSNNNTMGFGDNKPNSVENPNTGESKEILEARGNVSKRLGKFMGGRQEGFGYPAPAHFSTVCGISNGKFVYDRGYSSFYDVLLRLSRDIADASGAQDNIRPWWNGFPTGLGFGQKESATGSVIGKVLGGEVIRKGSSFHVERDIGNQKIPPANNEKRNLEGGDQYTKETLGGWENRDKQIRTQGTHQIIGVPPEKLVRDTERIARTASTLGRLVSTSTDIKGRDQGEQGSIFLHRTRNIDNATGDLVPDADVHGNKIVEGFGGHKGVSDNVQSGRQYESADYTDTRRGNDLGKGNGETSDIQSELVQNTQGGMGRENQSAASTGKQGLKYALSSQFFYDNFLKKHY